MITLFYAEIDTATGALAYVNAGHNPPLVARSGGALEPLEATSVVLGAFRDVNFESRETRLEPGERLLLYTDGVTEAWNSEEQEYGAERLRNFLAGHPAEEGKDLVAAIVSDVLGFSAGTRLSDDMTLVSIRLREAGGSPERASS
jgi:sigma-B regulation protein RsbU (phosphoserine phosphatase)